MAQTGERSLSPPPAGRSILDASSVIYVTCFKSGTVQKFSSDGVSLGVFCNVADATGLAFDKDGNLFVSNDEAPGYSIQKITPDGGVSTFVTDGLNSPHGLAFDKDGNLYVANAQNATIEKYTPDGIGTVFEDASAGVMHPADLMFDSADNLWVTNAYGGSIERFSGEVCAGWHRDGICRRRIQRRLRHRDGQRGKRLHFQPGRRQRPPVCPGRNKPRRLLQCSAAHAARDVFR